MTEFIYKYELNLGETELQLPAKWKTLTAAAQGQKIMLWVRVRHGVPTYPCRFWVLPTGMPLPQPSGKQLDYVNTVFIGALVFHVFEVVP